MCNYAFSNGDGLCQSVRGINYFVIKFWFDKSWLLSSSVLSVIRYLRMHYNCHLSEYYIACNLILEWCKRITKIMFAKKNDILKWTNLLIESINELSDLLQTNDVFNKIIIRCSSPLKYFFLLFAYVLTGAWWSSNYSSCVHYLKVLYTWFLSY